MRIASSLAVLLSLAATPAFAQSAPSKPCPAYTSPDIQTHLQAAYKAAGKDIYPGLIPTMFTLSRRFGLCAPPQVPPTDDLNMTPVEPGKVFDQLYYIGARFLGTFALVTKDGIFLIDTLNNTDDVKNILEPGFKKLGLKMEDIKYVMMTHGLPDHWGGAKYIQDTYHPHIMMTEPDWAIVEAPRPANSKMPEPPKKDMVITENEKFTFGGITLTFYMAPGTTVGAPAVLIPVTDNGQPHLLSLMGGMGAAPRLGPDKNNPPRSPGIEAYVASAEKVKARGVAAGADGVISTHPDFEGTVKKLEAGRKPGDPNPWVLGKDGFARYMDVVIESAKTIEAMAKDPAVAKVN